MTTVETVTPEPGAPGICTYCHQRQAYAVSRYTTGGIIVLVAGIICAPACIGIPMILIALGMKVARVHCNYCGREY